MHENITHMVSVPQSAALVQPPQWPAPSHFKVPLQTVFTGLGGFDGTPAVQTSSVHWLLSAGTSVLSSTGVEAPCPSHTAFLQSPAICAVSTLPAAE